MTYVADSGAPTSRSGKLEKAIADLLVQAPEIEAAAVVSFDGLPMASALPAGMDEDRVAAMSAALLSLGERAAEGLGRGQLSQVYIEGESGTVFLISADDEAVLVAVAAQGAKVGMMLYEVRRAAADVAAALRHESPGTAISVPTPVAAPTPAPVAAVPAEPLTTVPEQPVAYAADAPPSYQPAYDETAAWSASYAPVGTTLPSEPPTWS